MEKRYARKKYHDLPGLLALSAPGKLFVTGDSKKDLKVTSAVYKASGASDIGTANAWVGQDAK